MSEATRTVLVSNRLPVTVQVDVNGVRVVRSMGGLATGLSGVHERGAGLWIGWPGETAQLSQDARLDLDRELAAQRIVPVHLGTQDVQGFYDGFCNGFLWPLFHYLIDRLPEHARDWDAYQRVNEHFAEVIVQHHQPGDAIWVHDYQLMLVPALVRRRLPEARIGFFLHIPFPATEIFRILPWREAVLEGLLGADLVGFHTLGYARQFANAALHLLGLPLDVDRLYHRGRVVRVGAFPMGIDARSYSELAASPEIVHEATKIRAEGGAPRILLGVDRLDYTKGIPRRLRTIERLLELEPGLRGNLRFIQIASPSRTQVHAYGAFRQAVNEHVGRINGAYGSATSVPIHYVNQTCSQREVTALYCAADVMLVTPLRDGMNLVAKEFVASRVDEDGVLVLSEFAGAAAEMGEAILVNPYDIDGVARTIARALEMPRDERRTRMWALRQRVMRYDVDRWTQTFLDELGKAGEVTLRSNRRASPPREMDAIVERLRQAEQVLWMLDYDGTLVPFASRPELARPDAALRETLRSLATRPNHFVHVVSGRPREVLEDWLGDLPVGLHAEHGLWSRKQGEAWTMLRDVPTDWKERVRAILEQFAEQVPGAMIEEKTASIAWHYRMADAEFGEMRAMELQLHLNHTLSNLPVEVLTGAKVIEVRPHGVNKGTLVGPLIARYAQALPIAIGDDQTDENLFAALPEGAIAIHVGPRPSVARYRVADLDAVRAILRAVVAP